MLERLIARLRGELAGQPAGVAADIYGGVGVFALYLADLCRRVTLVELDPLAVEAAERSAAAWQLDNLEFLSRHAERALPELPALDLAVVDPPRSGLDPQVINALAANGVPRLFYVSCAPASLARDLALLQARGFAIRSLEIFDFYPQTYHVESLAILER
jgi:23S rRNA (uracil1939-C5)-methyltransferase